MRVSQAIRRNFILTTHTLHLNIDAPVIKQIRFDKVEIQATLEKDKLDIKSISLTGPDITGQASGSLKVAPYFPRSHLELDANLTISE